VSIKLDMYVSVVGMYVSDKHTESERGDLFNFTQNKI
jgi:hypothetical protein